MSFTRLLGDNDYQRGHSYYFPMHLRSIEGQGRGQHASLFDTGDGSRESTEAGANLSGPAREYLRSLQFNDPDRDFEDRAVKLATTFGGAGVVHGDLTPECAEVLGRVLDALGAAAGKEDSRSQEERYHHALAEAMRRLLAAGLLPGRAGQPVKAWVHISLADLLLLDAGSALQEQWTARVREQWAARRAFASETGSEGGAWLEGTPPRRSRAMRPWRPS